MRQLVLDCGIDARMRVSVYLRRVIVVEIDPSIVVEIRSMYAFGMSDVEREGWVLQQRAGSTGGHTFARALGVLERILILFDEAAMNGRILNVAPGAWSFCATHETSPPEKVPGSREPVFAREGYLSRSREPSLELSIVIRSRCNALIVGVFVREA